MTYNYINRFLFCHKNPNVVTLTSSSRGYNKTPKMLKAQLHDTLSPLLLYNNAGTINKISYFTLLFVKNRDVNV